MIHVLQKINTLKWQSFIDWPASLQRVLLIIAGIALFWILNKLFFSTAEQAMVIYKKSIDELTHEVQIQQQVILQTQTYLQQKSYDKNTLLSRVGTLNFSNFMAQISTSSRQNHLEIQAMKPLASKKPQGKTTHFIIQPFQINAIGKYSDLLQFMRYMAMFPALVMVDDFQIAVMPAGNTLKLAIVVDLYARAP